MGQRIESLEEKCLHKTCIFGGLEWCGKAKGKDRDLAMRKIIIYLGFLAENILTMTANKDRTTYHIEMDSGFKPKGLLAKHRKAQQSKNKEVEIGGKDM